MNSTVKYIITAAITLAIAAGLVAVGYSWGKSRQYNEDLPIQTEYIQQIDSLEHAIDDISRITVKYTRKCDSLQLELNTLSIKSQELKRYYNAKIRDITLYNNTELQRFFTDRYSR